MSRAGSQKAVNAILPVRVAGSVDGMAIYWGVPVNFKPVGAYNPKTFSRLDRSRKPSTVVVPFSNRPSEVNRVELPAGLYEVDAVLPSGEHLNAEIELKPGENAPLILSGAAIVGDRDAEVHFAYRQSASVDFRPELFSLDSTGRWRKNYDVQIGERIFSEDGRLHMQMNQWESWFNLLERQYNDPSVRYGLEGTIFGPISEEYGVDISGGVGADALRVVLSPTSEEYFSHDIGRFRKYLSISSSVGRRIFVIPPMFGHSYARFEIYSFISEGKLCYQSALLDERWSGLFAYLNTGRTHLASQILNRAGRALFEKVENPLAAAAGGYVLLSTLHRKPYAPWPDWLDNLSRWFRYLPDGPILRAKWLIDRGRDGDLQKAKDLIFQAYERGLPYFSIGVTWLTEALMRFSVRDEECRKMLEIVRGVARTMDMTQAFTSFYFAPPEKRSEPLSELHSSPSLDGNYFGKIEERRSLSLGQVDESYSDHVVDSPIQRPMLRITRYDV